MKDESKDTTILHASKKSIFYWNVKNIQLLHNNKKHVSNLLEIKYSHGKVNKKSWCVEYIIETYTFYLKHFKNYIKYFKSRFKGENTKKVDFFGILDH